MNQHRIGILPSPSGTFLLLLLVFAPAVTLLAGCNVVAPAAYLIEGPPTTDPLYTLPQKKIVVFVDDRGSVIPRARLRREMALKTTNTLLLDEKLVPAAITPDAAIRVASIEDYATPLAIDEVGRQVGAEVIIYVEPIQFALIAGGNPRPVSLVRVKVVDCKSGERLWPTDPAGYVVTAQMALQTDTAYTTPEGISVLQTTLAEFTGLRVAQLFYKHELNPLDARVNP